MIQTYHFSHQPVYSWLHLDIRNLTNIIRIGFKYPDIRCVMENINRVGTNMVYVVTTYNLTKQVNDLLKQNVTIELDTLNIQIFMNRKYKLCLVEKR